MTEAISRKRVLGNIAALLSGTALSRTISAVILILIARQLGPEAYGQYSASIALVGLVAVVFSLGLERWLLYRGGRDRQQLDLWFTSASVLLLLFGIGWMAGLWELAPRLNPSSYPWILIFLASFALWLEEAIKLEWSAFKAILRNDLTSVLVVTFQVGFLIVVLLLANRGSESPATYMAGRVVAAFISVSASTYLIVRRIGIRFQLDAILSTLRGSLPFAASTGFSVIYGRADLAIVGNELGKAAAGVYAPALTLTNTLFLIPTAVYEVMVPILGQGMYQDDHHNPAWVRRIAFRMALVMAGAGVALAVGLALISGPLVKLLYGTDFGPSADVLRLLSGVLAFRCPTIAVSAVLVAAGWQTPRVAVQAAAAVLNVCLNLLVVQRAGVMGVTRVYLFSEGILLLGHLGLFLLWARRQNRTT